MNVVAGPRRVRCSLFPARHVWRGYTRNGVNPRQWPGGLCRTAQVTDIGRGVPVASSSWEPMMNPKRKVNLLAAAIVALTFGATALADGPAKHLPVSDFVDTQGSTTIFNPPVPD